MSKQIQFELASPQKMAVNKAVAMVIVPGAQGRYGVLPDHAPLATEIGAGLVEIYEDNTHAVTSRFFVAGGFCQVAPGRCTILADQILKVEELDRAAIRAEIKNLQDQALAAQTEEEQEAFSKRLDVERAKLFAAAA